MSETLMAIDFGGSQTSIYIKDSGLVLKEPTLICAIMTENGYEVKSSLIHDKLQSLTKEDKANIYEVLDVLIQQSKNKN